MNYCPNCGQKIYGGVCYSCRHNLIFNPERDSEACSMQQAGMARTLDLLDKLGAALEYQSDAWGLYGEESKAALREWKEWKTRHTKFVSESHEILPTQRECRE